MLQARRHKTRRHKRRSYLNRHDGPSLGEVTQPATSQRPWCARSVAGAELVERLDDELFAFNERLGHWTFPQSAKVYLDDWSAPGNGWLRK
ncbi:DUF3375 family protein [Streptomyces sp. NPDC052309]|uniref:DUF3375 family protein n=1 Tax=Streptomyces sp. NPDC052309 TaxID=3155421 RepID=UPI00343BF2CB